MGLLRWGEFTTDYVKKARLLEQEDEESGWTGKSFAKLIGISIICPMIAIIPFVLNVTDDCVDSLIGHSVWVGGKNGFIFITLFFSLTHALESFIT